MFRRIMTLATAALLMAGGWIQAETKTKAEAEKADAPKADQDGPLVQMAILLDNSGSMSGLINQARQHLWKIVNEFATVRRNGKVPRLQVALYKYANGKPERLGGIHRRFGQGF